MESTKGLSLDEAIVCHSLSAADKRIWMTNITLPNRWKMFPSSKHRYIGFQNSLHFLWCIVLVFKIYTYTETYTHILKWLQKIPEFISLLAVSVSFCLARWLARIPSCNILPFCSQESCFWVSFHSSITWRDIIWSFGPIPLKKKKLKAKEKNLKSKKYCLNEVALFPHE